jgi:hypothetical protein
MPFDKYRPNPFNNMIKCYINGTKYTAEERWDTILVGEENIETPVEITQLENLKSQYQDAKNLLNSMGSSGHDVNPFYNEWSQERNTGTYLNSSEKTWVNNWFTNKIESIQNQINNIPIYTRDITQSVQNLDQRPLEFVDEEVIPVTLGGWDEDPGLDRFGHATPISHWEYLAQKVAFRGYFDANPFGYYMSYYAGKSFWLPSGWAIAEIYNNEMWSKSEELKFRYIFIAYVSMDLPYGLSGAWGNYGWFAYPCLPHVAYVPFEHKQGTDWLLDYKKPFQSNRYGKVDYYDNDRNLKSISLYDWKKYMRDHGHQVPEGL